MSLCKRFGRFPPLWMLAAIVIGSLVGSLETLGQPVGSPIAPSPSAEASSVDPATLQDLARAANQPASEGEASQGIDFMSLLIKGGVFMIPIALVSLVVVMFIFERLIGLRRGKMFPSGLARELKQMIRESESIDPRIAYGCCADYPSAASNVVRAVLLRAGRPQQEVEAAASEVSQREADKAFGGVRWLYFCVSVAPLLGLLGTVWGLIRAFHDLTLLGPMQSRAEFLGRGIYEALVTTLAGLVVAIPAAVAAHAFEGRILRFFRSIDELVFALIPKFERYEGRVRFDPIGRDLVARNIETAKKPASAATEGGKSSVPPVQNVATGNSPHAASGVPTRKSISKP